MEETSYVNWGRGVERKEPAGGSLTFAVLELLDGHDLMGLLQHKSRAREMSNICCTSFLRGVQTKGWGNLETLPNATGN